MLRALLTALGVIALAGTARAVCGDGIGDPGELCDPGITSAWSRCCNATCDAWVGADEDNLCDDEELCTESDSARLTEATLRMDRIAPPAGDERLRFGGRLRVPESSFVDPAVAGFRFGLYGETYYYFFRTTVTPMIAARIPGGDRWRADNGSWRFRDSQGRYGGVTSVALKVVTSAPVVPNQPTITLAYKITARRGGYVVTPEIMELYDFAERDTWGQLEAKMALGSSDDGSATCAQRTFPAFADGRFDFSASVIPCTQNGSGSRISCSTAPPVGPCRVGEPRDVLVCDVLAVAAAQEAYKAAHGSYFATSDNCANVPGYEPTPGVSCSIFAASSTGFKMGAIHENAPAYTCMYDSTATPALDCF